MIGGKAMATKQDMGVYDFADSDDYIILADDLEVPENFTIAITRVPEVAQFGLNRKQI